MEGFIYAMSPFNFAAIGPPALAAVTVHGAAAPTSVSALGSASASGPCCYWTATAGCCK